MPYGASEGDVMERRGRLALDTLALVAAAVVSWQVVALAAQEIFSLLVELLIETTFPVVPWLFDRFVDGVFPWTTGPYGPELPL